MLETTLAALPAGTAARVERLTTAGDMRRRLLDVGLTPGTAVSVLCRGRGGSAACDVRGAVIALRRNDCLDILAEPLPENAKETL